MTRAISLISAFLAFGVTAAIDTSWFEGMPAKSVLRWKNTPPTDFGMNDVTIDEIEMQEYALACNQSQTCAGNVKRYQNINCMLRCISPACYAAVLDANPLELGEINVKFQSYKMCLQNKRVKH